jgi:hypothetical protein
LRYSGARRDGETWTWNAAVERRSRLGLFQMLETPEPARRRVATRAAVLLDAP